MRSRSPTRTGAAQRRGTSTRRKTASPEAQLATREGLRQAVHQDAIDATTLARSSRLVLGTAPQEAEEPGGFRALADAAEQALAEDDLKPRHLRITYTRGSDEDELHEDVFEDPSELQKGPRLLVSLKSVLALKTLCEREFRRVQELSCVLNDCRAAYFKELIWLREQLHRGEWPDADYEVFWYDPPHYMDDELKEFLKECIRFTNRKLIVENSELRAQLQKGAGDVTTLSSRMHLILKKFGSAQVLKELHLVVSTGAASGAKAQKTQMDDLEKAVEECFTNFRRVDDGWEASAISRSYTDYSDKRRPSRAVVGSQAQTAQGELAVALSAERARADRERQRADDLAEQLAALQAELDQFNGLEVAREKTEQEFAELMRSSKDIPELADELTDRAVDATEKARRSRPTNLGAAPGAAAPGTPGEEPPLPLAGRRQSAQGSPEGLRLRRAAPSSPAGAAATAAEDDARDSHSRGSADGRSRRGSSEAASPTAPGRPRAAAEPAGAAARPEDEVVAHVSNSAPMYGSVSPVMDRSSEHGAALSPKASPVTQGRSSEPEAALSPKAEAEAGGQPRPPAADEGVAQDRPAAAGGGAAQEAALLVQRERHEAEAARLKDQAAEVEKQLREEIASLAQEVARLRSTAPPREQPAAPPEEAPPQATPLALLGERLRESEDRADSLVAEVAELRRRLDKATEMSPQKRRARTPSKPSRSEEDSDSEGGDHADEVQTSLSYSQRTKFSTKKRYLLLFEDSKVKDGIRSRRARSMSPERVYPGLQSDQASSAFDFLSGARRTVVAPQSVRLQVQPGGAAEGAGAQACAAARLPAELRGPLVAAPMVQALQRRAPAEALGERRGTPGRDSSLGRAAAVAGPAGGAAGLPLQPRGHAGRAAAANAADWEADPAASSSAAPAAARAVAAVELGAAAQVDFRQWWHDDAAARGSPASSPVRRRAGLQALRGPAGGPDGDAEQLGFLPPPHAAAAARTAAGASPARGAEPEAEAEEAAAAGSRTPPEAGQRRARPGGPDAAAAAGFGQLRLGAAEAVPPVAVLKKLVGSQARVATAPAAASGAGGAGEAERGESPARPRTTPQKAAVALTVSDKAGSRRLGGGGRMLTGGPGRPGARLMTGRAALQAPGSPARRGREEAAASPSPARAAGAAPGAVVSGARRGEDYLRCGPTESMPTALAQALGAGLALEAGRSSRHQRLDVSVCSTQLSDTLPLDGSSRLFSEAVASPPPAHAPARDAMTLSEAVSWPPYSGTVDRGPTGLGAGAGAWSGLPTGPLGPADGASRSPKAAGRPRAAAAGGAPSGNLRAVPWPASRSSPILPFTNMKGGQRAPTKWGDPLSLSMDQDSFAKGYIPCMLPGLPSREKRPRAAVL